MSGSGRSCLGTDRPASRRNPVDFSPPGSPGPAPYPPPASHLGTDRPALGPGLGTAAASESPARARSCSPGEGGRVACSCSRLISAFRYRAETLSSRYGTHKTVKAKFWPWVPENVSKTFKLFSLRSQAALVPILPVFGTGFGILLGFAGTARFGQTLLTSGV